MTNSPSQKLTRRQHIQKQKENDILIADIINAPAKIGRPSDYDEDIAAEICLKLATGNKGIVKLCEENPHWPKRTTIFEWRLRYDTFANMYAKAKQDQVEYLVDEITEIADNIENDTDIVYDESGEPKEKCNREWILRSRLRIDTRKWIAAKLAPRLYGDKIQNETTVTVKHEQAIKELE